MTIAAYVLPSLVLCLWLVAAGLGFFGSRRLAVLSLHSPEGPFPSLSVIVPARNEAAALPDALRSLLLSDYPALEVRAVDDRSTDATGRILDALAQRHSRVRV